MTPLDTIANILEPVKGAGELALQGQRRMDFCERGYKGDGSVITGSDTEVERYLLKRISGLYPQANLLAEETARLFDSSKPFTFAIDPIDGSDAFSQGMAGWCISVGVLDAGLTPVAGAVYAPRLDLLFFADIGRGATLNGKQLEPTDPPDDALEKTNLMVSSRIHREIDLGAFPGKIRNIGSGALHFCFPLLSPGILGAVQSPIVHIWDICGAHAVNRAAGYALEFLAGGPIDYAALTGGDPVDDFVLSGSMDGIETMRGCIARI
jgi:myo-inositol-1(or 4)-monophosphatase